MEEWIMATQYTEEFKKDAVVVYAIVIGGCHSTGESMRKRTAAPAFVTSTVNKISACSYVIFKLFCICGKSFIHSIRLVICYEYNAVLRKIIIVKCACIDNVIGGYDSSFRERFKKRKVYVLCPRKRILNEKHGRVLKHGSKRGNNY